MKKGYLLILMCTLLSICTVSACSSITGLMGGGAENTKEEERSKSDKKRKGKDKDKDNEEDSQETSVDSEEKTDEQESLSAIEVPPNSALDDGNLFGNTLCYARIIRAGDNIYFRNAFDNERLYSIGANGALAPAFGEIYPKDMQYKDGYIYYANTARGDIPSQDTDRNIYRLNVSTGVNERLTNISFDNSANDVWLSLDTLVGDYCYFTYYEGKKQGYHIACVNITNAQTGDIHIIPVDNCMGSPMPNVVDNKLYYRAKDGLNVLDMSTGENALIIPGFSCESYMIYDNKIFYTVGLEQGEANVSLMGGFLDAASSEMQVLYRESEPVSIVDDIQFNIYGKNIYFVTKSPSASDARTVSKLYKMNISGGEAVVLEDNVTWFNIIEGDIYYKYAHKDDVEFSRTQPMYRLTAGNTKVINAKGEGKRQLLFAPEDFNKGWKANGKKWYYYDANGNMLKSGWQVIDGNWYFFYDDGSMAIDTTVESGGKLYHIDVDGKIYTYN